MKKLLDIIFQIYLLVVLFFQVVFGQEKFKLPDNYAKDSRPSEIGSPVLVNISIDVEAINPFQVITMDFRMRLKIHQEWIDKRLEFSQSHFQNSDHFLLPFESIEKIWLPDPNIVNSKQIEIVQLDRKLMSIKIFQNQKISFSMNFFATVACSMNYQYYPYDFQVCPFIIESFSHDQTKVKYKWSEGDAFQINDNVRLIQFNIVKPVKKTEIAFKRYGQGSLAFSRLVAFIHFERSLGNHLIQTFAPCSLIISLSWFSFWLEMDSIPARVSLLVTALLTLVTQFSSFKFDLPPIAYIKAVDIWMAGCLTFIFSALMEFICVKVIHTEIERRLKHLRKENEKHFEKPDTGFPLIFKFNRFQDRKIRPNSYTFPYNRFLSTRSPSAAAEIESKNQNQIEKRTPNNENQLGTDFIRSKEANSPNSSEESSEKIAEAPPTENLDEEFGDKQSAKNIPDMKYQICHWPNVNVPLVWTNGKGQKVILWREIDNHCKWIFPFAFLSFSSLYWIVLFVNSISNRP